MDHHKQNELLTPEEQRQDTHQNTKKCHICEKSFHFRKKIICSHCENSFCTDHCCKEIPSVEGAKTICDMCYHRYRKGKLQEKISEEADLLSQELVRAKEASSRLERDLFNITAELNSVENDFSHSESGAIKTIALIEKENVEMLEKLKVIEKDWVEIEKEGLKVSEELKDKNKKFLEVDSQLEEVKNSLENVKNVKGDLNEQLLHVKEKIKYCLDYPKTTSILCEKCKEALQKAYNERIHKELEDSSMSLYETTSILDSVREMKESLNALIVEPEHDAKCFII